MNKYILLTGVFQERSPQVPGGRQDVAASEQHGNRRLHGLPRTQRPAGLRWQRCVLSVCLSVCPCACLSVCLSISAAVGECVTEDKFWRPHQYPGVLIACAHWQQASKLQPCVGKGALCLSVRFFYLVVKIINYISTWYP